jgi:hypothetical protein
MSIDLLSRIKFKCKQSTNPLDLKLIKFLAKLSSPNAFKNKN